MQAFHSKAYLLSAYFGNAMLTVGGSIPYSALYGWVPIILPSIDHITTPGEDGNPNRDTLAHTHRLREVSVQAMVEGSARARLGRALNTRTTMPAQKLNLQVGEEVDFNRSLGQKDTPGWSGPAEVVDASRATRGVVTLRWQNRTIEAQIPNVRRHSTYSQQSREACGRASGWLWSH